MGILPMSITGILPVSLQLSLLCEEEKKKQRTMGKMPMGLMARMAMLRLLNEVIVFL